MTSPVYIPNHQTSQFSYEMQTAIADDDYQTVDGILSQQGIAAQLDLPALLTKAADQGRFAIASRILEDCVKLYAGQAGFLQSSLSASMREGNLALFRKLVEAGALVDYEAKEEIIAGSPPIWYAVAGPEPLIVQDLIALGAGPKSDNSVNMLLERAAAHGTVGTMQILMAELHPRNDPMSNVFYSAVNAMLDGNPRAPQVVWFLANHPRVPKEALLESMKTAVFYRNVSAVQCLLDAYTSVPHSPYQHRSAQPLLLNSSRATAVDVAPLEILLDQSRKLDKPDIVSGVTALLVRACEALKSKAQPEQVEPAARRPKP